MDMPDAEVEGPAENFPGLVLQNESIALTAVPEWGGKVTSLRTQGSATEWLLPPLRPYHHARRDRSFAEGDGGGFDECLPTVAASGTAPDHGEAWRVAWQGGKRGDCIDLAVQLNHPPLRFARTIALHSNTALLQYTVRNGQPAPAEFLWSAHPLLAVEEGDRIVLPAEVTHMRVEYSAEGRIAGSECSWPLTQDRNGQTVDLSRVGPRDGRTAEKLFAGPLRQEGWCGFYRPRIRQGIVFRFDPATLPYVGLWICHGAWPEAGTAKQYTVALEPTTGNCDALDAAVRMGTATVLGPGESLGWTLQLTILGERQDMDYETFCAMAAAGQQA